MSDPVAVPITHTETPSLRERSDSPEEMVLDEGLDLSEYRSTHQSPLVADYFDISELYGTNKTVNEMVDSITGYLISKTEGQSMVFVVKQILNELSQEMNLKDNDAPYHKLRQVHKLIQRKQNLEMIEDMRRKAMQDIEDMV